MAKQYINESQLRNIIAEQVKAYLVEEFFGNENFYSEAEDDERLSDMNNESEEESELRDSIESFFKQPGVNCAAYAYNLYGVKASKGEDTDEMKNARSKFAKCLNHEKNEAGYPYSFDSSELNTLKGMISSNQLNERINKAVDKTFKRLNEIGDTEKGQEMLGRLQARQQVRHGHATGENNGYGYLEGGNGKNNDTSSYAYNKRTEVGDAYNNLGRAHANGFASEYNKERRRLGYTN